METFVIPVVNVDVLDGQLHWSLVALSTLFWALVHVALHGAALVAFPWYRAKSTTDRKISASYFLSSAHAILSSALAIWALWFSGEFAASVDSVGGWLWARDVYTVHAPRLQWIIHTSLGYFVFDTFMMLFVSPNTYSHGAMVHHFMPCFMWPSAVAMGWCQYFMLHALFSEITTPLVNLYALFREAGVPRSSPAVIANAVVLLTLWVVVRLPAGPIQAKWFFTSSLDGVPLWFYAWSPAGIAAWTWLNTLWFSKMISAVLKLVKSRQPKAD